MKIAVIASCMGQYMLPMSPWVVYSDFLHQYDIEILNFDAADAEPWKIKWDAMIFHPWHHWANTRFFNPHKITDALIKYSTYRTTHPAVVQIACNHSDMSKVPFAAIHWRMGDPVLARTPPYDKSKLFPFPSQDIYSYEIIYGAACFESSSPTYNAGLICSPSGPANYRKSVVAEVAKVGYGVCLEDFGKSFVQRKEYNEIMSQSRIIVCPQGWGGQSERHWDAWKSKKPVLTDAECDSVEMIPGVQLKENEHYLVYQKPEDIPDIVSDWSKPSRADDLQQIAENGHKASMHRQDERILQFFKDRLIQKKQPAE